MYGNIFKWDNLFYVGMDDFRTLNPKKGSNLSEIRRTNQAHSYYKRHVFNGMWHKKRNFPKKIANFVLKPTKPIHTRDTFSMKCDTRNGIFPRKLPILSSIASSFERETKPNFISLVECPSTCLIKLLKTFPLWKDLSLGSYQWRKPLIKTPTWLTNYSYLKCEVVMVWWIYKGLALKENIS